MHNTKQSKSDSILFSMIWVIACIISVIYFKNISSYKIPLGTDGLTAFWPIAQFLHGADSISNFFKILCAGYMGEDHLTPIRSLFGYMAYSVSSDPVLAIGILSNFLYILIVISSLFVVFRLWEDRLKVLIFFILFTFNLFLVRDQIITANFSVSVFISLWSYYFFISYIRTERSATIILSSLLLILAIFSNENTFILPPFYLTLFLMNELRSDRLIILKIKRTILCSFVLITSVVPYLILHDYIYGTILPASRSSIIFNYELNNNFIDFIFYYIKMIISILSSWSFGIFHIYKFYHYSTIIIPVIIFCFIIIMTRRHRLLSTIGYDLFCSLVVMVFFIIYTGRYGNGIWFFGGIILSLIATDVFANYLEKFHSNTRILKTISLKYLIIASLIPILLITNIITQPYYYLNSWYKNRYESKIAAYNTIGQNSDKIIFVRLPGSDQSDVYHPIDFWMGNKMFNSKPALNYYEEYNQLIFKNMYVETYSNENDNNFNDYRNYISARQASDEVILFKNRNTYFRIFTIGNNESIYRASVILYAPQDYFDINLPDIHKNYNNINELQFDLKLKTTPSDIKSVIYGGEEITTWKAYKSRISFVTNNLLLDNKLIINTKSGNSILEMIEVKIHSDNYVLSRNTDIMNRKEITLITREKPCRYFINPPNKWVDFIVGTLDAHGSISINTLLPDSEFTEPFELTYSSFELNRAQRTTEKITIDNNSKEDYTINIFGPNSLQ